MQVLCFNNIIYQSLKKIFEKNFIEKKFEI